MSITLNVTFCTKPSLKIVLISQPGIVGEKSYDIISAFQVFFVELLSFKSVAFPFVVTGLALILRANK